MSCHTESTMTTPPPFPQRLIRPALPLAAALMALVLPTFLGCDRQSAEERARAVEERGEPSGDPRLPRYDAVVGPLETPTPPPTTSPAPPTLPGTASTSEQDSTYTGQGIAWRLPTGWQQRGASGMRYATLIPPNGPEVSVTRLTGDGGGVLANVNRWRGQVFLPPLTAEQLPEHTRTVAVGAGQAIRIDVTGPQGRVLGAILPSPGGMTWFLKAQTAEPASIDAMVESFDQLLESIRLTP